MNVLYIVSRPLEINTSASVRNRATILGLLENGHSVDLFTTEPDKNHKAYDASLSPKGVSTTYVNLKGVQSLARVGRKFAFLQPLRVKVYKWKTRNEVYDNLKGIINYVDKIDLSKHNYDLIISSSDPKSSHLFVMKLLEKQRESFSGKWIQIWGDPFLGDITLGAKRHAGKIKSEEAKLLAAADKVVYVSRLTMLEQQKLYPESAAKMTYSPIPYSEKKMYPIRQLKNTNPIEIVYCGDYNSSVRNIRPLYDAVNGMENIHLTICGGTDLPMVNTDKVTVYGRVSYAKVMELEEKADVLIHLSNLSGSQIPGKIYQYSGTNKPILFILDGDTKSIYEQFAHYSRYVFSLNDKEDIMQSLETLIEESREWDPLDAFDKGSIARTIIE